MPTPLPYRRLSGFYFFYFALLGATAPLLPLYLEYLAFSPERIGELIAIPMLMRCVAPNLWGWLGDKTGQRLAIVRLGAFFTLCSFMLIFISQSYAWLALVMVLHAFFWHAILPQFEAITLAHLGKQVGRYSQIRLWGSVGFIVVVVSFGYLFKHFGLSYYPIAVTSVMLGIFLSSLWVPHKKQHTTSQRASSSSIWQSVKTPSILAFYLCIALMQLSHGPYYTFFSIYLEQLGYSRDTIGWLWSLGVVAEIILFLIMPYLLERCSLKTLLISSFMIATLRWVLLGHWAESWVMLLFIQVLHAATFGCFHVAAVQFIQRSFTNQQQGQAQAFYVSASGAGAALGALYAGYSWKGLSPSITFLLGSLAAIVAAMLLSRYLKEPSYDANA
ncbi:MFS transporter [Pseudomonas sp. F1_0610]|uniref:MFS transporter n=1 Tax=Pseudomonas sp. F1_0610 TaxID=3114284 RepID=UPI0039C1E6BC